jgi:hypothetical protein
MDQIAVILIVAAMSLMLNQVANYEKDHYGGLINTSDSCHHQYSRICFAKNFFRYSKYSGLYEQLNKQQPKKFKVNHWDILHRELNRYIILLL